jgi:hypothetical protein
MSLKLVEGEISCWHTAEFDAYVLNDGDGCWLRRWCLLLMISEALIYPQGIDSRRYNMRDNFRLGNAMIRRLVYLKPIEFSQPCAAPQLTDIVKNKCGVWVAYA